MIRWSLVVVMLSGAIAVFVGLAIPSQYVALASGTVILLATVVLHLTLMGERNAFPIHMLPGTRLSQIFQFLYCPKDFKNIFEPAIADMQTEYLEALAKGNEWHARFIWLRGTCAVCLAAATIFSERVLAPIVKILK